MERDDTKSKFYKKFKGIEKELVDDVLEVCEYNEHIANEKLCEICGYDLEPHGAEFAAGCEKQNNSPNFAVHKKNDGHFYSSGSKMEKVYYSFNSELDISDHVEPTTFNNIAMESTSSNERLKYIQPGTLWLILMRGLPGSGKSTEAEKICGQNGVIFTLDKICEDLKPKYQNDEVIALKFAHKEIGFKVFSEIKARKTPIIIDHFHLDEWEMKEYVKMADDSDYQIEIVEPKTPWAFDITELTLKNRHNLSKQKIRDMMEKYKTKVTVESIRQSSIPTYIDTICKRFQMLHSLEDAEARKNTTNNHIFHNGPTNISSVINNQVSSSSTSNQPFKGKGARKKTSSAVEQETIYNETPEEIVTKYQDGSHRWMILMRGLPGSGKSRKSRLLSGGIGEILSTNDFFMENSERYNFVKEKLEEGHVWNQDRARNALSRKVSPIIIDNVNSQAWEMKPYVIAADQHGYDIDIIEPDTPWKENPLVLSQKCAHGVDVRIIEGMLRNFDKNVTLEKIRKSVVKKKTRGPTEVEFDDGVDDRNITPSLGNSSHAKLVPNTTNVESTQSFAREHIEATPPLCEKQPTTSIQHLSQKYQSKLWMVLMRGLPGCGKTYRARELKKRLEGSIILSTNDFFEDGNGRYCFDIGKLGEAHQWNQERAKSALEQGISPIFIDNTNSKAWEMKFYTEEALSHGYEVDILEPDTHWAWDIQELEKRNLHGVQENHLKRMINGYEKNVNVDKIKKSKMRKK